MLLTTAPAKQTPERAELPVKDTANETIASAVNVKAIAGGIGGAVAAVLLVAGAVILRKTCRALKEKDAAKPGASAHELQRKDRADAIKLTAGAPPKCTA